MNALVTPTEMLKLTNFSGSRLTCMNSMMSGWSTFRMAMLAPRRVLPCFTTSVAASKGAMKLTGPEATPPVDPTTSPLGRSFEKENPVPPPLLWISAVFLTVSKMLSRESSIGRTKHAESCCSSRPAFMSVGELGRNSSWLITSLNSSSIFCRCSSLAPYSNSACERFVATRRNIPSGFSNTLPSRSLLR